ncbi:MAG: hypothetical protein PVG79_18170, partial [Gemmatimonadales bacterium]
MSWKLTNAVVVLIATLVLATSGAAQGVGSQGAAAGLTELFVTADRCIACHSGLTAPSGEDVSIGFNWRSSMMANSARDPYWQAAVRREVLDHPQARAAIEDKCATCHMPMARFGAAAAGGEGEVFVHLGGPPAGGPATPLARDGASCTTCHQIRSDNFGQPESFTGGFIVDTAQPPGEREIYGPFEVDSGRVTIMRSAAGYIPRQGAHVQEAELCATCHTLYTHALDAAGQVVGELPEQVPYLEWAHSEYRGSRSCQDCHMPQVADSVPVSSVLGEPRPEFSRHVFRGGNFFMLGLLNKYRAAQSVTALPVELDASVARTVEHLGSLTAVLWLDSLTVSGSQLQVDVAIENLAGHKLPSAYPSRRAWLHLIVRDAAGAAVFESGALRRDGSIAGNDNDADAGSYEPHYTRIERSDQVQIYEPIMVDAEGRVTTGLLFGVRYVKDNRLLPRGFDKATAEHDIAVQGRAADDADFQGGGDRVRYRIDLTGVEGPVTVIAELWYQPIGYRWAHNLEAQPALETQRFVGYYEATAASSAARVAGDSARADVPGPAGEN